MKHQRLNIGKIDLYVKDPFKSACQLLIKRREKVEIKNLKSPKAFIEYLQTIDNIYENLQDSNPIQRKSK